MELQPPFPDAGAPFASGDAMAEGARTGDLAPAWRESADVEGADRLRDGQEVRVRRMTAGDRERIEEFLSRLTDASLSVRFFTPLPRSTALATLMEETGSPLCLALLLLVRRDGDEQVIAHAEYVRDGPTARAAEVAFLVADAFQGHGGATVLLHHLAVAGRRVGIREFHGSVLMENDRMLEVFRGCGYPLEEWWGPDAVQLTLSIGKPPGTGAPSVAPP